ncbi:hypothetical protein M8818_005176 [Zalaria obscura]|uniref:Uncharacterized protein n=1 Tax=Zalaria obscura TaxID=2024903 RepID=A0ACC3SCT0_9PEZI
MQAIRNNSRLPQVYRIVKSTPAQVRNMSLFGSFGPRFPSGEFAPLFRLLDDYASHVTKNEFPGVSQSLRSFTPRFDVREVKDAYELHGELPGIAQKDINIEFTDPQTLTIKGRTERHTERGTPPSAAIEGQAEQGRITSGEEGSHYHKATVEDEDANMSGALPSDSNSQQASTSQEVAKSDQQQQQVQQRPESRYWVSERSVGEFHRTFSFPSRVDQDNVKASLKDGILSIIVPKATTPSTRRINIE